MILIKPIGGLANRMRVVASALWLSNITKNTVKLIWNINEELYCEFNDLFRPIDNIELNENIKYNYIRQYSPKYKLKHLAASTFNKLINVDFCITESFFLSQAINHEKQLIKMAKNYNKTFIETCQQFGDSDIFLSKFVPKKDLQKIINIQTSMFSDNTIGLHIRRQDNIISTTESPLELFINRVRLEIKKNKHTTFYLSTDDLATEHKLTALFGERILTRKKQLDRISSNGIKDALVDMFCLSNTKYIYGSYWSSFSDVSARLGKINCLVLKK